MAGKVLVLDDDADTCDLMRDALSGCGYEVTAETRARDAIEAVQHDDFDVVLTDLQLDEMDGFEVCERIRGVRPNLPVMVVTGHASLEAAISAMRAGSYDFVTKPIDLQLLSVRVERAIQHHKLRSEVKRLRDEVDEAKGFEKLIGRSPVMLRVFDVISRVAQTDATVLVTGESGTGKELVARAIHERSGRKDGPFVAVNCAAVPAALLESELFGHSRGAFTDAKSARKGLFLEADGGTLFLDEIGEMPLEMQVKLLRALQERTVRPLGGGSETPFNARVIAATNRDLEAEVDARRFREDLYYRINVVSVLVPPLRDRHGDVPLLAQRFVERFAAQHGKKVIGIGAPAAAKLIAYSWPGNVRELQNSVERAVALTRFDHITVEDLPERIRLHRPEVPVMMPEGPDELVTVDELERRYLLHVLKVVRGNKSRAARILGYDRRTLYRKLERMESDSAKESKASDVSDSSRPSGAVESASLGSGGVSRNVNYDSDSRRRGADSDYARSGTTNHHASSSAFSSGDEHRAASSSSRGEIVYSSSGDFGSTSFFHAVSSSGFPSAAPMEDNRAPANHGISEPDEDLVTTGAADAEQETESDDRADPEMVRRAGAQGASVLLVDEVGDARDLTAMLLERDGFRVRTADSLHAGIAGSPVDVVVITDNALPASSAAEMAKHLMGKPAIALAARGFVQPDPELFRATLQRPVAPDMLVEEIRKALRANAA